MAKMIGCKCPVIWLMTFCLYSFSFFSYASFDATHCISLIGSQSQQYDWDNAMILKNNCDKPVNIVWCTIDGDESLKCHTKGRKAYYQKSTVLKPQEEYRNAFTAPYEADYKYAACFGGYYSVVHKLDRKYLTNGAYYCKGDQPPPLLVAEGWSESSISCGKSGEKILFILRKGRFLVRHDGRLKFRYRKTDFIKTTQHEVPLSGIYTTTKEFDTGRFITTICRDINGSKPNENKDNTSFIGFLMEQIRNQCEEEDSGCESDKGILFKVNKNVGSGKRG